MYTYDEFVCVIFSRDAPVRSAKSALLPGEPPKKKQKCQDDVDSDASDLESSDSDNESLAAVVVKRESAAKTKLAAAKKSVAKELAAAVAKSKSAAKTKLAAAKQSVAKENKPASANAKKSAKENKPASAIAKKSAKENKPVSANAKKSAKENKPVSANAKKSAKENKLAMGKIRIHKPAKEDRRWTKYGSTNVEELCRTQMPGVFPPNDDNPFWLGNILDIDYITGKMVSLSCSLVYLSLPSYPSTIRIFVTRAAAYIMLLCTCCHCALLKPVLTLTVIIYTIERSLEGATA
jgi:hypothetical protein